MKKTLLSTMLIGASLCHGSGVSVLGTVTKNGESISTSQMDSVGGQPYRNTTVTSTAVVQGGGNDDKDVFQPTAITPPKFTGYFSQKVAENNYNGVSANKGGFLEFFGEKEKAIPPVYVYFDADRNKFMPSRAGEDSHTLPWGNGSSTYSVGSDGKIYLRYESEDKNGDPSYIETWFALDAKTKTFSDGGNRCELFYYDKTTYKNVNGRLQKVVVKVEHEVCVKVEHTKSSTGGNFRMIYYPTKYGSGGTMTYTW